MQTVHSATLAIFPDGHVPILHWVICYVRYACHAYKLRRKQSTQGVAPTLPVAASCFKGIVEMQQMQLLFLIPKHLHHYRDVHPTVEIWTQKRLGSVITRFYIVQIYRHLLDCYGVLPVGIEGSSPYQCSMCGVFTSSQALLEAHFKGRRHLKRALEQAHADAADLGLQPTPAPASAIPR